MSFIPHGRIALAALALFAALALASAASAEPPPGPVIVTLSAPGLQPERIADDPEGYAATIAHTADTLLDRLSGHAITNLKRYDFLPILALTVDADGLAVLFEAPEVAAVEEDIAADPALSDGVSLIRAEVAHFLFYRGSGQTVAVLDTGIDRFHPSLIGRVVSGACFSTNLAAQRTTSLCPGGATSSTAIDSGRNCDASVSGCSHGTQVAGVVAGVAPAANLIAIQVFSRRSDGGGITPCADMNRTSPCVQVYDSDLIAGLNRVLALHLGGTWNVAAVNMSLGGGRYFDQISCDQAFTARKLTIDILRNAGVASVAGAVNDGYRNAMGSPACLSSVISVAAATKADRVASFSNISPFTTLLAPGESILTPLPGGGSAWASGTSVAAAMVAGALAVLRQAQPSATVAQLSTLLAGTGPVINDQRSNGFVGKRRLDVWTALCNIITCDADDFRTLLVNQTLNGTISPSTDRDHYYYNGTAGERLTFRMNRTSGSVDPFLELYSPSGFRAAFNDNGGGGFNSLINGYLLPQSGRYVITASGRSGTGGYQLLASREAVATNPVPRIDRLSPTSATATIFGSDFWVAIYGSNFIPESQVRWNGQLRAQFYSSNSLVYIRVLGSDLSFPAPPRLAFVTVANPLPGGGTSNSHPFSIKVPFLGESELDAPQPGSSVAVGTPITFQLRWTHPDDSWRTMQNMDLRLRDEATERIIAWVRVVERPGEGSFYRLVNDAGEVVGEGQPGEYRDIGDDAVTLHLAQSTFAGSGSVATMSPRLTFGPEAVGTWRIEFAVDNEEGEVQADDVLGTFTVLPEGCPAPLSSVSLVGPETATVDTPVYFTAAAEPVSGALAWTWAPEPESGQGTPSAMYLWEEAGERVISLSAEGCAGFHADASLVRVSTGPDPDLVLRRIGPHVALAGEPIAYTLTVTNRGATAVSDLEVSDMLPLGAVHVEGGMLDGDFIRWMVSDLDGFGAEVEVSYVVTTEVSLAGGPSAVIASGEHGAELPESDGTRIVDALVPLDPLASIILEHTGAAGEIAVEVPEGAVFEELLFAYEELDMPAHAAPEGTRFAGRAFRLSAFDGDGLLPDLILAETVPLILEHHEPEEDAAGLALYRFDGAEWSAEGITCAPGEQANVLDCQLVTPGLGLFALFAAGAPPSGCVGDCNGDGVVSISELILGVNIALETAPLATCSAFDTDGNARVTVNELIAAVNAALHGCGR